MKKRFLLMRKGDVGGDIPVGVIVVASNEAAARRLAKKTAPEFDWSHDGATCRRLRARFWRVVRAYIGRIFDYW